MMDMELLAEKGHCTLADKESFSLTIEFPNFQVSESYKEVPNGSIARVIKVNLTNSPMFILGQSIDLTSAWSIQIQCGDQRSDENVTHHAEVHLKLLHIFHSPYDFVFCRFKISLVDKDGYLVYVKNWPSWETTRKIHAGTGCKMPDFIVREDLVDNKDIFMSDNTLRLKLEGVLFSHFKVESIAISKQPVLPLKSLSSKLWTSMELYDVKLITKDEKAVKAHKLILSKASPLIKALLSLAVAEGSEHKVLEVKFLCDFTESEISKLLEYIYTGHIDQDWSNLKEVTQLISIGDKYEIRGLQWLCFKNILNHLTISNFTEVVALYSTFSAATVFQSFLHKFFLKNQDKLIQMASFQEFAKEKKEAFLYVALFRGR